MNIYWRWILFFIFSSIPFFGCTYTKAPLSDLAADSQHVITSETPNAARSDCDTLVITCIDYRFAVANQEFINNTLGLKDHYDHISIPGSIYNLINQETRSLLFSRFTSSMRHHLIKRVVIIGHKDCGGYGGSSAFGSEIAEHEYLCTDLRRARALIIEKYPTLDVDLFLESLHHEADKVRVRFEKIL
ncbi:MAG: hypothetical protein E3K32_04455 [wastewater metagenome]|nr:hypothetical protein [Candidatus Loosdrechtia aerotolerans]